MGVKGILDFRFRTTKFRILDLKHKFLKLKY